MAINERLIDTEVAAAGNGGAGTGNQEEGLILHLDANDVDSYDGDGDVWYDIKDHEYTPATNVDEHFNTIIWNGDGASSRSFTDVGFQPDLVWVKARSAQNHTLYDSVRGVGKYIASDTSAGESTDATYGQLTSFDVDGFTATKGTDATYSFFNSSNSYFNSGYVAWCFKAGGAYELNEEGSIDSQVSVNNDLGFSIATYTGVGYPASSTAEIGHGLDTAPELVIIKGTGGTGQSGGAGSWVVGSSLLGAGWDGSLYLNSQNGYYSAINYFWNGKATSSVIKLKNDWFVNGSNNQYVAYCFTSKRGVSKVGSYKGTGTAGNKVYTGFEPAFVMIKNTSDIGNWIMIDNKRATSDPRTPHLRANTNGQDDPGTGEYVDFDRDGFTVDGTGQNVNDNSDTYIYYVVAKDTNETSLIPDTDLALHLDAASFPQFGESDYYSNTPPTWTDLSSNSYNGTINGAVFDSELGNWLDFDGVNDEVNWSTFPTAFQSLTAITMELWLKFDTVSGTQYPIWLGRPASGKSVNIGLVGGKIQTWVGTQGFPSLFTPVANKWYHLAVTISGTQQTVYVDGEDYTNSSNTQGISMDSNGANAFLLGDYSGGTADFNGQIGQVRIYSSALTQDQIRQNYNFTKNNYPNGNDGTLTNMSSSDWNPSGYFNFDGSNDYIQTDLTISSGSVTTSIWFNADIAGAGKVINYFQNNGGRIDIEILGTYSNSATVSGQIIKVNCTTATSQWNHLAIVYTGWANSYSVGSYGSAITAKVYLNDSLVATVSPTPYGQTTGMRIGRSGGGYYYDGKVSKVKVFDKELTSSEITALYNEGE